MQILSDANVSFRLMTPIERFFNIGSVSLWPTNETLTQHAGQCSERTIKRDLAAYEDLGLLIAERGWRRNKAGKLVRTRLLRLALPEDMKGTIDLIDEPDHGDMRGPDDWRSEAPIHGDHACPNHGDTRGPFTVEDTLEEGALDATQPL